MKKIASIALALTSLIIIVNVAHIGRSLMMFLLVRQIPGTDIYLSPTQMIGLMLILASVVVYVNFVMPFIARKPVTKSVKSKRARAKKSLKSKSKTRAKTRTKTKTLKTRRLSQPA